MLPIFYLTYLLLTLVINCDKVEKSVGEISRLTLKRRVLKSTSLPNWSNLLKVDYVYEK